MKTTWFLHGTCTPCGFCTHVDTMWLPHWHHMVSQWIPPGFHVDTIWFPCAQHVVSRWTTHGFKCGHYMISMWKLSDHEGLTKTTLFPCRHHMLPHGHHVVSTDTTCLHMDTIWLPCGYYVVSMCTPCSFHMDTMWYLSGQNVFTTLTPYGIQVDTT